VFWAPDETVSVTDSRVPCPFVERVGRACVPVRARPLGRFVVRARWLGRFAVERLPPFAERPLDVRPVERLLVAVAERDLEAFDDARPRARRLDPWLVEEDLEEDDVLRRWDVLGWAMLSPILRGIRLPPIPGKASGQPLACPADEMD
jgi:hypothetical protein